MPADWARASGRVLGSGVSATRSVKWTGDVGQRPGAVGHACGLWVPETALYRAVDWNGQVNDVYVSKKRDTTATTRFFTTPIAAHGVPVEVTTDKSPVLAKTIRKLVPGTHHETAQYANNRVENDHGRLKARLRPMRGYKPTGPRA